MTFSKRPKPLREKVIEHAQVDAQLRLRRVHVHNPDVGPGTVNTLGQRVFPDNMPLAQVQEAIQAAALVGAFDVGDEIARRYGLDAVCLHCGARRVSERVQQYAANCGELRLLQCNLCWFESKDKEEE